jgi:hypothetical protein
MGEEVFQAQALGLCKSFGQSLGNTRLVEFDLGAEKGMRHDGWLDGPHWGFHRGFPTQLQPLKASGKFSLVEKESCM